jgi:hypothetical protein
MPDKVVLTEVTVPEPPPPPPPVAIVAVCPVTPKVPGETTISLMLLPIIVPSVTVSKPLPRSEPVYSGGVEDAMFLH